MALRVEIKLKNGKWYKRTSTFKTIGECSAWLRRMHQIVGVSSCFTQHVAA